MERIIIPIITMIQERKGITEIMDEITQLPFDEVFGKFTLNPRDILVQGLQETFKVVKPHETNLSDDPKTLLLQIFNNLKQYQQHHIWEAYLMNPFSVFILNLPQESFNDYIELEQQSRLEHYRAFFIRKELISELVNRTHAYGRKQFVNIEVDVTEKYDGREFSETQYFMEFVRPDEVTPEYVQNLFIQLMESGEENEEYEGFERVHYSDKIEYENGSGTSIFKYDDYKIIEKI